ncbi:MAG: hypothetical protein KBA26_05330 [Candidatus Delongbacteria bacterium]|nr:hypothetical protein [Candidatus Delongbacteria bacterium]
MRFDRSWRIFICLLLVRIGLSAAETHDTPADSSGGTRLNFYLDQIKSNLFRPEMVREYTDSIEAFWQEHQRYRQSGLEDVSRLYVWQQEYEIPPRSLFQGKIFSIMTPSRIRGNLIGSLIQIGRDVIIDSGAIVDGEIICIFCNVIDRDPSRAISGTRIIFDPVLFQLPDRSYQGYLNLFLRISFFLLLTLLILHFRSGLITRGQTKIRQMPLKSFLTGLLAFLLFLPIIFLCIAMILGIPLIIPIVLFFFWSVIIGYIITCTIIVDSMIQHFHLNASRPLLMVGLILLLEFWIYGPYFIYQITPIRRFFELEILIWIDVVVKIALASWGLGGYLLSLKIFNEPALFPMKRK